MEILGDCMSLLILAAVAGSLIAILPASILFLYIARFRGRLWLSALLGGVFWLVALLARLPIILGIELGVLFISPAMILTYAAVALLIAALMAGLFEEGIKYLFVRSQPQFIETEKHALCFGFGWGLGEALLIYVVDVLTYAFLYPFLATIIPLPPEAVFITSILIGSVERNLAIIFHVSATILVALAVWHGKRLWVWLAILVHFLFDFIPLILLRFVLYPILGTAFLPIVIIEALIAIFAVFFALTTYFIWRKEGGPTLPKPETQFT